MSKHALPTDANPLAKAIGKKLTFIVKQRQVEWADAARQCGIGPNRFHYILQGAQVPDEREAQRIAGWLFEAKDYTKDPLPKTPAKVRKGRGFKAVKVSEQAWLESQRHCAACPGETARQRAYHVRFRACR